MILGCTPQPKNYYPNIYRKNVFMLRNSQNSDTLYQHFLTISAHLGNIQREPTDKCMVRHWGSVSYLHTHHLLQGLGHPQASRQHDPSVPRNAGSASGSCVLLQALGGPTLLSFTLPSQVTAYLYLKGALFHFFFLTTHLLHLISFSFFHYLHVDVL